MIPYGRQRLDAQDVEAVLRALQSDYLTTGPLIERFEEAFAARVGASHAVAVSSATAALHLLMLAMDLQPGDAVITSPNTFLSTANAVAFVGATPVFADTNAAGNLDVESMIGQVE
jgi:perosamine synthetase